MAGELFKDIMQWELESQGIKGKIPIFYFDNTMMSAVFTASTQKIRPYLPHPRMHPVEAFPGRCLVAFTAFEYRHTDIDPYNELGISILISFGRRPIPGLSALKQMMSHCFSTFVWRLPVTTEIARKAGVELYGYPKFLADIVFNRDNGHLECKLSEQGDEILSLRGRALPTSAGKQLRYRTFSVKDGVPLCANVYTHPMQFAKSMSGGAVHLELGTTHPISKELRGIGLGKKPVLYMYSPVNEAVLFGPRNLIDN